MGLDGIDKLRPRRNVFVEKEDFYPVVDKTIDSIWYATGIAGVIWIMIMTVVIMIYKVFL